MIQDIKELANPYEDWDEEKGKTRERMKQRWHGFEECREKLLAYLSN